MKDIRQVKVVIEVAADTDEEAIQMVRDYLVRGMSERVAEVVARAVIRVIPSPDLALPQKS